MKIYKAAIFLIAGIVATASASHAQSASSADLINNAKSYDGKAVNYRGEVIGDVMARGQYAWVNLNDGQNAIGVWADKNLINDIRCGGSYSVKGDEVEVIGIFHRACPEHGGDLDIHASSIHKIFAGGPIHEPLDFNKLKWLSILSIILVLSLLWPVFLGLWNRQHRN